MPASRLTFTCASLLVAAVGVVADVSILAPGGPNLWWIAQSDNTLVWDCQSSQVDNFTVVLTNSDPQLLSGPFSLISNQQNAQCSLLLMANQINQTPGTGYMVQLENPLNATQVYTQSQPFEIKALGAAYPPASATPTPGVTASSSATGASASSSAANDAMKTTAFATGTSAGVLGVLAGILGLM